MAGLNLGAGIGGHSSMFFAPQTTTVPTAAPQTVGQAAYGPGASVPAPSTASLLNPLSSKFGLVFWTQVGCVIGLIVLRHSLRGKGK
jgi:hypothetical protein